MSVSQTHREWYGKKSANQYEKEQNNQYDSFIAEGFNELLRIIKRKSHLEVHSDDQLNISQNYIKPVQDSISKAWKDQAYELIRLSSKSYKFDLRSDWNDSQECWVGENIDTKKLVILYPIQDRLNSSQLRELENTARNIANIKKKRLGEIIVIFQKESDCITISDNSSKSIRFETEKSLLDNLVDFRDYYYEIAKRVESNKLPEADWNLNDVYVPSNFINSDDIKSKETIEEYLLKWLKESSQKQISLLGEYGQGKSSAALMFVYHTIELAKQNKVRVPILIELRGKSPRNLTPLEILGSWASQYIVISIKFETKHSSYHKFLKKKVFHFYLK